MELKGKKVLIMGLGTLGGGIASAKWFVSHGAKVTVTDLRTEKELKSSLAELGYFKKQGVRRGTMTRHSTHGKIVEFVLGKHRGEDFKNNDIVVVNPAVPRESKYLAIARKAGKTIVNDAKIFFDLVQNPVVAVTGTRGKTTTANWVAYFLKSKYPSTTAGGNSSETALLSLIGKLRNKKVPAVVELSSWQLELLDKASRGPDIAIITNIYPDHLNRYKNIRDYASAKANIFSRQTSSQKLILNFDNAWTRFFLSKKPKAGVLFFSSKPLPKSKEGIFVSRDQVILRVREREKTVLDEKEFEMLRTKGEHNIQNFLAAALAASLAGVSIAAIRKRLKILPDIQYREETVLKKKDLLVVNDSAGTSPDAVIAAIRRFRNQGNLILITGGTDKNLDFKPLAREIKRTLKPDQVWFLNGSATKKLISELKKLKYFLGGHPMVYEDLQEIIRRIRNNELGIKKTESTIHNSRFVILFSPGAASFEKFKNEFDRGEKFNIYLKELFGSR